MVCIIVERGVSEENNIVAYDIKKTLKSFFKSLRKELGNEKYFRLISGTKITGTQGIATYGLSSQISLTSVLLGTILDKEAIPFSVMILTPQWSESGL